MPKTECNTCFNTYHWEWVDAFLLLGFGAGQGQCETWEVGRVLVDAGYELTLKTYPRLNTVITSVRRDGEELIPHDAIHFGHDSPRHYLPPRLISFLDRALPSTCPD